MKWVLDPAHSQVQFSVKHLGISTVRGTFDAFSGSIDEENGQATAVTVEIDVASLDTGNEQRDGHLRSADFFDVENHPKATFALTTFERSGDDVIATGDLTIRGTTKPVTLKGEIGGPATDPWGNQKVSATLETKIARKEWGLVWNVALEAGGVLVSDDVKLSIDIQAQPA
ncbi:YceI family protein [Gemmatimonas sp.]|jgi:polyisoprenoid-binding protein YceI|uniref:YceI family protein n=1 Tax=Gemmatimonas sp. TaxID=1962908 RepID=UPI0037C12200